MPTVTSLFRKQYDARFNDKTRFYANSGERYKDTYVLDYDDNGCQKLKNVGCIDVVEEIQSHRESCDLSLILSRLDPLQVNGMMSTYSFDDLMNSDVVDVTELPKNAGEMLNMVKKGRDLFDGLPVQVREAFNFSPEKFISSFGSDEFKRIIDGLNSEINNVPNVNSDDLKDGENDE